MLSSTEMIRLAEMTNAVVVSAESYQRQQHAGESLVAFIRQSPLVGADGLELQRCPDPVKDVADLPVGVVNPWQDPDLLG